ncbi:MAG: hypothetical protein LKF74_01515 [Megasphaera sp.]|nr:hypothetical protein [Megasphaera sp.]MCH4187255.1 hypothetical protein [Megasphaera sp.]MCH4217221.1 hypothetical protein [Megasphaera sp.]
MKRMKVLAVAAFTAASMLLSGCGSNPTMMEEYSFGYVQLKAGNSEVYMMSPFDLGHMNRQNGEGMMYANNDKHLYVIAVPEPASEGTPQQKAEKAIEMLKQTSDVSNLQTKVTSTTVSGREAVEVDSTYDEPLNGQRSNLTVRGLFFEDNGQVWYVMYMYRSSDAMGKDVTDHVFGQLK